MLNTTNSDRTVTFETRNYDNMIFGYKTNGASNYQSFFNPSAPNSNNGWWFPADLTISLPNHSITTFEVVTMLGGGHSGTNNRIVLH